MILEKHKNSEVTIIFYCEKISTVLMNSIDQENKTKNSKCLKKNF